MVVRPSNPAGRDVTDYLVDLGAALLQVPDQEGLTPYSWRGTCRVPGCRRPATDPHHIVSRGRIGFPARYIMLDGQLVPNVAGLCAFHHNRITIGESLICWILRRWHYRSPERDGPDPLLPLGNEGCIRATGARYCPVCGRPPVPRDPYKHTARPRRPVTIRVPDDAENGAEILASLVEQVGERIGLHDPTSPGAAYYAISAALSACIIDPAQLAALRNTG
jgi:hypothetical protein